MKVRIKKAHLCIGARVYNKGDVVDVSYPEETMKRMLKSGNFEPAPGQTALNEAQAHGLEEDEDFEDEAEEVAPAHRPTRATPPRQPRPKLRRPAAPAAENEDELEPDDE